MGQFEQIELADGLKGFRKFIVQGTSDRFMAEARGLAALASAGTVHTPEVLTVDEQQLVTRLLDAIRPSPVAWQELGRQLAQLHLQGREYFGFDSDNYCGATPQPNPRYEDGHLFFAEQRLLYQGQLAIERGLLRSGDLDLLESLCKQLPDLIPPQGPALLHGDLWSGNVMFCSGGPYLIDPACYYGWPEADLAMTTLFGRFDGKFYEAYREVNPLEDGFEERLPLYNLYHLLNHMNIFGRSYHSEVIDILKRFN